jgi:hypothetical protein
VPATTTAEDLLARHRSSSTLPRALARSLLLLPVVSLLLAGTAQAAGDPIMPLDQVRSGMRCTGYSVIRGTAIASFDVEIIDVVSNDRAARAPRILFRVSGPAIDPTGIGPGFSGSPIYCDNGDGVRRNIGAISEGIGEYGSKTALATPIERILGEPVDPPASTRYAPRTFDRARLLAGPLSVTGLSAPLAGVLRRAGARAGRSVYAAPGRPRAAEFPQQALRPGSAFAIGLASGDISAGSVGTISYVDGDRVWGFGHPLDGAGRRALFLQDAYVYTVVNNPVAAGEDVTTYKLAAPGHNLGTLTNDGLSAVAGRLGALPASFPLKVNAKDLDTGRTESAQVQIADEREIGQPTGVSGLSLVAPLAVGQAAATILQGAPARQSGKLCMSIVVRERKRPLGFCNAYVGGGGNAALAGAPMIADAAQAVGALDSFLFGPLHVTAVSVELGLRRTLRQAYLTGIDAPRVLRRGRSARIRVRFRRVDGPQETRTVALRVPRSALRGSRRLRLTGAAADAEGGAGSDLTEIFALALGDGGGEGGDETGPRTLDALAKDIAGIHRYDGVTASLRAPGGRGDGPRERRLFRDATLRLSGTASTAVTVR